MAARGRATLKEVAALARVSVGTASRALNDTGYVSEEARARVLSAARKLNYQPDLRARGLRQRSSWTIGLIIPDLLNAYYTALANTASQLLSQRGYHLILASTADDPASEQSTLYDMVGQGVEGLIWVPTCPEEDLLGFLNDQGIPVVAIVRRIPNDAIDTVVFKDMEGSRTAVQHLIGLGHTRIGYIGGDASRSSNRDRWQGYVQAHEEACVPIDDNLVKLGAPREAWGRVAAPDLLELADPPTALFVGSNGLMPGVMRALRQYAVDIPDQMSLICFDDIDWFSYSVPPITAVKAGHEDLAEVAVNLVMRRIQHPADLEQRPLFLMVGCELVLRESTAPPPRAVLQTAGGAAVEAAAGA